MSDYLKDLIEMQEAADKHARILVGCFFVPPLIIALVLTLIGRLP